MSTLNILILRPDNLGDIILFSGMLKHIRALYPQAEITLSVKKNLIAAIELCPYIDQVMEYEKLSRLPLPWFPDIRGKYKINWWIRHILNLRYKSDILLLPVRSPNADIFEMHTIVSSIRARIKIGIAGNICNQSIEEDNKARKIYSKRLQLKAEQYNTHELEINRDFLIFLGSNISKKDVWPELWTDNKDKQWASNAIPHNNKITLAICPGVTSTPGKFYPGVKYANAISKLDAGKYRLILFGTSAEKKMCEEVANELSVCKNVESVYNFCGQTTIRRMIEGIKRCDLLISQETGALHIGVALNKPSIGILGGGHFGRFYPWGNKNINRVVHKQMDCYWCYWKCIYPTMKCIQDIPSGTLTKQLQITLKNANLI